MKFYIVFVVILTLHGKVCESTQVESALRTTAQRIATHNYPVETHKVNTPDGYILTMFRIPYSPKLKNQNTHRPVVLLQHGVLSSSDSFVLNGPDNAITYLLADAGYDVWMGNARGNKYSKMNVAISHHDPLFWEFSFDEIGLIDMPSMIDYALSTANETALHYVAHSEGTTVFVVLMSSIPSYNAKIKTSHLLAPVVFRNQEMNFRERTITVLLENSMQLLKIFGRLDIPSSNDLLSILGSVACADSSPIQWVCANILANVSCRESTNLNYTLLSDFFAENSSGASIFQIMHHLQTTQSGRFRKYDHGTLGNIIKYNHWLPPDYKLETISAPVWLYYGQSDLFSTLEDVLKFQGLIPNVKGSLHLPEYNHFDFQLALNVKANVYDLIIAAANDYEIKPSL